MNPNPIQLKGPQPFIFDYFGNMHPSILAYPFEQPLNATLWTIESSIWNA